MRIRSKARESTPSDSAPRARHTTVPAAESKNFPHMWPMPADAKEVLEHRIGTQRVVPGLDHEINLVARQLEARVHGVQRPSTFGAELIEGNAVDGNLQVAAIPILRRPRPLAQFG